MLKRYGFRWKLELENHRKTLHFEEAKSEIEISFDDGMMSYLERWRHGVFGRRGSGCGGYFC